MKTKETTSGKTLLEEVGEKLQLARQELDELAVQLALGKAEVKDKFEEMKKSFLKRLNELNETFSEEIRKDEVRRKIGMLEVQLNTSQTDEKKLSGDRIQKILAALEAVKAEIRKKIKTVQQQAEFDHEVEMFRLKLEILRLKFGLKKFEVKEDFRERMGDAKRKIETFTTKAREKIKSGKNKYTGFSDEAQMAYKHFRKALEALQH